ncbi:hypothetical protein [Nonomuraea rhodomycinica]|uniref:Uncharacterized protein n=1 Tax=Nonomuraea rhodomycinica TaxID=1712872 RepID=A0A7Y6MBL9_9ACTN|nr:hypothetical protein [Nonomuraea rhodomycinica]NUW40876.1 hypothetical protein [Nonomuraea rhodomycinica]
MAVRVRAPGPWTGAAAVLVVVAALWVSAPVWSQPHVRFVRPSADRPVSAPGPRELRCPAPAPVRYAYRPVCGDGGEACEHWILVSTRGERRWLPHGFGDGPLALSRDGTRAAYWHQKKRRYAVVDLAEGATTFLPRSLPQPQDPGAGGQAPLFSLDGRHLLVADERIDVDADQVVPGPLLVVDVARGRVTRLPRGERALGWTGRGLALVTAERTGRIPGHVTSGSYVVRSPEGTLVSRAALPGGLAPAAVPAPSGETLATVATELTPAGPVFRGVVLTGTRAGRPLRTVVPRLPAGWRVDRLVRWEGEDALVAEARGPHHELAYHLLGLADGSATPLGFDLPPPDSAATAVPDRTRLVVGRVR